MFDIIEKEKAVKDLEEQVDRLVDYVGAISHLRTEDLLNIKEYLLILKAQSAKLKEDNKC